MRMKKIGLTAKAAAAALSALLLTGCAGIPYYTADGTVTDTAPVSEETEGKEKAAEDTAENTAENTSENAPENAAENTEAEEAGNDTKTVRIGSLKGPTSMGLVGLMDEASGITAENSYEFTMETQADALLPRLVSGELDIALVPANVAAVLYNKTEGGISVIDVNTLGVLYVVSGDKSIESVSDLSGKTIYTTGKGTTPEYVLNYILSGNGAEDVKTEFRSEAAEVAALLAEDPSQAGLLPQPFATVAMQQNDALSIVLDMTEEWNKLDPSSSLVTGVTVASKAFIQDHPDLLNGFLKDHEESVLFVNSEVEKAAQCVADQGIVEKAPIAAKAIPFCNIVCITGEEMKSDLNGYLKVLFEAEPASTGGALPGDDFYYTAGE